MSVTWTIKLELDPPPSPDVLADRLADFDAWLEDAVAGRFLVDVEYGSVEASHAIDF